MTTLGLACICKVIGFDKENIDFGLQVSINAARDQASFFGSASALCSSMMA
jgi:hypothetical protein